MELNEKAETAAVYSVTDAAETEAGYRILSLELAEPDGIGTDEFPQFGHWLEVEELRDGAGIGELHVECPQSLAAGLVENGAEIGDVFEVVSAEKSGRGRWLIEVEVRGSN